MKINGFFLFLLLFLLFVIATSLDPAFRYLKYFLPLFALGPYFFKKKVNVEKSIANYYSTFLVFYSCVIGYLFIQNIIFSGVSGRFLPNAVFILSPLLFIFLISPFFNKEKAKRYILAIFIVNIFVFFNEEGKATLSILTNLSILKDAIISSKVPTENHLAFVFGFLVIYFSVEKYKKWYLIIAAILFILCFKRIAILAVLVSLSAYFIFNYLRIDVSRNRKKFTFFGVLANLAYILIAYFIVSGIFDHYILQKTGFTTDRFILGRKTYYREAFTKAGPINWFGTGLGKMDDIIFNYAQRPMNLHSEILKNYLEFGIFLFITWLFIFFYKNFFSNKALAFLLYINILMFTDNVFIYADIMFYFYFFILIYLHEINRQNKDPENEIELAR